MKLLVLAGGFGTRLRTAVGNTPKALAPIGDIPFLQLQLENWHSQGVREFVFLLQHQADKVIDFLIVQKSGLLQDCIVDWVIEPIPMGTGGAVALAVRELGLVGDFLVTNADTWLDKGIIELNSARGPAIAVKKLPDVSRYGQVIFDPQGWITCFAEKSSMPSPGWINTGLCRLSTAFFDDWDGNPFSMERDMFVELVQGGKLQALPLDTSFMDIGVVEDYSRFCDWINLGRRVPL